MASICLLLKIEVQYALLIHPMNVQSEYLNVSIDNVELPEGFGGKNGSYAWKLKKNYFKG